MGSAGGAGTPESSRPHRSPADRTRGRTSSHPGTAGWVRLFPHAAGPPGWAPGSSAKRSGCVSSSVDGLHTNGASGSAAALAPEGTSTGSSTTTISGIAGWAIQRHPRKNGRSKRGSLSPAAVVIGSPPCRHGRQTYSGSARSCRRRPAFQATGPSTSRPRYPRVPLRVVRVSPRDTSAAVTVAQSQHRRPSSAGPGAPPR